MESDTESIFDLTAMKITSLHFYLLEQVNLLFKEHVRHMKENNKSKAGMNIFHQTRRRSAIIAGLLWHFADAEWWKIC